MGAGGRRAVALAAIAVVLAGSSPAAADPPSIPPAPPLAAAPPALALPSAPAAEPLYDPAAHGGLPLGAYLRMTRGTRRRSTGMMIAGILLTSVGLVGMGTGTGVFAAAGSCDRSPMLLSEGDSFGGGFTCGTHAQRTTGMSVLLASAITVGLGVPLWILGASDVPWQEGATLRGPLPSRPTWAQLVPGIAPGPRGVSLAWRF